jgi:hypothetical protein
LIARTTPNRSPPEEAVADVDQFCPVCGAAVVHEKCKVVCRSGKCVYRIIFNCSEF